MRNDLGKLIEKSAQAHSDLNIFASIVSILDGGHLYCNLSQKTASKIIKLCKAEQIKRLREYDALIVKAGGGNYE